MKISDHLSYFCILLCRFMTDAARREHETLKKKVQPKLSLSLTGSLSRNSVSTPPRHTSGNLTPPVTPPITPSSSFRSSTPTGTPHTHTRTQYTTGVHSCLDHTTPGGFWFINNIYFCSLKYFCNIFSMLLTSFSKNATESHVFTGDGHKKCFCRG